MVTDVTVCTSCRFRGGVLNSVTVCTVGSEHWRGSLSDRVLIAENRCAALFVSTESPARRNQVGAAVWALARIEIVKDRHSRPSQGGEARTSCGAESDYWSRPSGSNLYRRTQRGHS